MQHVGIDSFNTTWCVAYGLDLQFHYSVYCMSMWKVVCGCEERGDGIWYLFECAARDVEVNQMVRSLHPHST